jgi:anion-transporting  ArsA/GET3 family ATPase
VHVTGALSALLSRRLLLVTGKGGTGKTSIAAALGVVAARAGMRTVVVELGTSDVLPELLGGPRGDPARPSSREPAPVAERLFRFQLEPERALEEYLALQLHVRLFARAIVGNAGFHAFLDAAPGWRELITLGKLWHLVSLEDAGRPRWPLLVVDAPATGHGLSLLSAPSVVIDAVRMGPLRRNTDRVQELVTDPTRTWVLPVTLPEELPVKETLELRARVRALGVGLGPLIANGVEPGLGLPDAERALACVARLPRGAAPSPLAEPEVVAAAARHRLTRNRMQREYLGTLARETGEAPLELPWLAGGVDGPDGVRALAEELHGALA